MQIVPILSFGCLQASDNSLILTWRCTDIETNFCRVRVPGVVEAPQEADLVARWDETTEGPWLVTQPESSWVPNGQNDGGSSRNEEGVSGPLHCS